MSRWVASAGYFSSPAASSGGSEARNAPRDRSLRMSPLPRCSATVFFVLWNTPTRQCPPSFVITATGTNWGCSGNCSPWPTSLPSNGSGGSRSRRLDRGRSWPRRRQRSRSFRPVACMPIFPAAGAAAARLGTPRRGAAKSESSAGVPRRPAVHSGCSASRSRMRASESGLSASDSARVSASRAAFWIALASVLI
jgi:hypothetical protein